MEHTTSGPLPRNDPDGLDVRATDITRARAREILDAVSSSLEEMGVVLQLGTAWKPRATFARWKRGLVQILIREKTRMTRVAREGDRWAPRIIYVPTGELAFKVGSRDFTSIKRGKLEERIDEIVSEIIKRAEESHRRKVRSEERRKIEEEKEAQRREEERNFSELLRKAEVWWKSEIVSGYLDWVEQKALSGQDIDERARSWLEWGRKVVAERMSERLLVDLGPKQ